MGSIEWDMTMISGMVAHWTNQHAQRVDGIAQGHIDGAFTTSITLATPETPFASIMAPGSSLELEYGTAQVEPAPWGMLSIMEAGE